MTSGVLEPAQRPPRFSRASEGRVLGGVCAGLPSVWGLGVTGLRLVFVLAGLCGGIGVVAYVAFWLILPVAGTEPDARATPPVVLVAAASGGLVALVLVLGLSAFAEVFGLGWLMFGLAAVVLVAALGPLAKRVPVPLALLAVAALTVPSLVVALTPLRMDLQDGPTTIAPRTVAQIGGHEFSSGFGTQFIDLRRTKLPSSGTVHIRIKAGVRRTIVALPTRACVRVQVTYSIHPFAAQLATLLSGDRVPPSHAVVLFGIVYGAESNQLTGIASHGMGASGPTLDIDYSSQGGGLFVRDYPDGVSPSQHPSWPGFIGRPEPRPNLDGEPKQVRPLMVRDWKRRRRTQIRTDRRVDSQMGGPCAS